MASGAQSIFAISSGAGRAGVAVVRLSGPATASAVEALAGTLPPPRTACLRHLRAPGSGEVIDRGLVLWFPGPASFTGEDLAEFHVHGSRAVLSGLLDALGRLPGLRPAAPGEFTRRAFGHGKLDLAEVEGLADLIEADTAAQRRQALRQMEGGLSRVIEGWRDRLMTALAHLEAAIDFSEEEIPADLEAQVGAIVSVLKGEMAGYLADQAVGERLREGVTVAIVGPPNAGKSSLLNTLARREAAIVSERAGTTRDVIEVALDIGGFPVVMIDTAGLRDAADAALDPVEVEGIRRARARAAEADLKLAVFDLATWPVLDKATLGLVDDATLVVLNKADAVAVPEAPAVVGQAAWPLSLKTGAGIERLVACLEERVAAQLQRAVEAPLLTRARHREAVADCVAALERVGGAGEVALQAEELRLALRALGQIGRAHV